MKVRYLSLAESDRRTRQQLAARVWVAWRKALKGRGFLKVK